MQPLRGSSFQCLHAPASNAARRIAFTPKRKRGRVSISTVGRLIMSIFRQIRPAENHTSRQNPGLKGKSAQPPKKESGKPIRGGAYTAISPPLCAEGNHVGNDQTHTEIRVTNSQKLRAIPPSQSRTPDTLGLKRRPRFSPDQSVCADPLGSIIRRLRRQGAGRSPPLMGIAATG